jgi:carbonic anhydrase
MPVCRTPSSTRLCRRLAAALLGLACAATALAAEHAAAPASPPAPASGTVAPAAASAPAARRQIPIETRDPLEIVRDRLAEKLGAIKAPDAANAVRVSSQTAAVAGAGGLAPARTPAAGSAGSHSSALRGSTARVSGPATRPTGPEHGRHGEPGHWDYAGAGGPDHWAELDPAFAACSAGKRQSPIDIRDGIKVELEPVQIDYHPSAFGVIDNGHTVQVNVAPGNTIDVMGRRYELVQFHFHRPSEERIDGRQFDMVAHLVHKDAAGRLAVIAVLLERGAAQATLQSVWNNLPLEKGEELRAKGQIDLQALLPADRAYYTYMGSLTTPPCSEGVLWMVMKNPVPVSADQIGVFARLYPMNARPVQSAQGRMIKESN